MDPPAAPEPPGPDPAARGVVYDRAKRKFEAHFDNAETGEREFLGAFDTEAGAALRWALRARQAERGGEHEPPAPGAPAEEEVEEGDDVGSVRIRAETGVVAMMRERDAALARVAAAEAAAGAARRECDAARAEADALRAALLREQFARRTLSEELAARDAEIANAAHAAALRRRELLAMAGSPVGRFTPRRANSFGAPAAGAAGAAGAAAEGDAAVGDAPPLADAAAPQRPASVPPQ